MVSQRVDHSHRNQPARFDHCVAQQGGDGPFERFQAGQLQAHRTSGLEPGSQPFQYLMQHLGVDYPVVHIGFAAFTGQAFQFVGIHPAPFPDYPVN